MSDPVKCRICADKIPTRRSDAGYSVCQRCVEEAAVAFVKRTRWKIICTAKGNVAVLLEEPTTRT